MTADALTMPRRHVSTPEIPEPAVSNTRLAIVIVITAESMLFAGLIGMFLVFRLSQAWPPPDLPRLPVGVAALNTVVLFASLVPLTRALRGARAHDATGRGGVQIATLLGALFLAVQGVEWLRLLAHGLTPSSSVYGATFYLLIGCHGLHVLAAVIWLGVLAVLERRARPTWSSSAGLEMCTLYWYFVCGLWAVLFPLVYVY
ncbi:MAG TPA: cytochrome c oxidase subunit 3 [Candidatus Binatia bacterium]|nr:cytochrome c oxidase subunit 3 [Candidatus Binatia bacterium]